MRTIYRLHFPSRSLKKRQRTLRMFSAQLATRQAPHGPLNQQRGAAEPHPEVALEEGPPVAAGPEPRAPGEARGVGCAAGGQVGGMHGRLDVEAPAKRGHACCRGGARGADDALIPPRCAYPRLIRLSRTPITPYHALCALLATSVKHIPRMKKKVDRRVSAFAQEPPEVPGRDVGGDEEAGGACVAP